MNAEKEIPVASRIKTEKYCYPDERKATKTIKRTIYCGFALLGVTELVVVLVLSYRRKRKGQYAVKNHLT